MSEMIERVARALADDADFDPGDDWPFFERKARAVIAAMREPTMVMRAAGQWAQFPEGALPPVVQCVGANFLASEIYEAMLAAALCDSGSRSSEPRRGTRLGPEAGRTVREAKSPTPSPFSGDPQ